MVELELEGVVELEGVTVVSGEEDGADIVVVGLVEDWVLVPGSLVKAGAPPEEPGGCLSLPRVRCKLQQVMTTYGQNVTSTLA